MNNQERESLRDLVREALSAAESCGHPLNGAQESRRASKAEAELMAAIDERAARDAQPASEALAQLVMRLTAENVDGEMLYEPRETLFRLRKFAEAAQPAAVPVGWLRDQRGAYEGRETLDPLFVLGDHHPPIARHGATYSAVAPVAAPQPAAAEVPVGWQMRTRFQDREWSRWEGCADHAHAPLEMSTGPLTMQFRPIYTAPQPAVPAIPSFWVRRHPDGTLTDEVLPDARVEQVRKDSGAWVPLHVGTALAVPVHVQAAQQNDRNIQRMADDAGLSNAEARRVLGLAAPAVPQGWKLVPVESTEEMILAGALAHQRSVCHEFIGPMGDAYPAMLSAAPQAPAAQPVAWRYVPSEVWRDHVLTSDPKQAELARRHYRTVEPLYLAPQAPTVKESLTDPRAQAAREVVRCMSAYGWTTETSQAIEGLRAALECEQAPESGRRPLTEEEAGRLMEEVCSTYVPSLDLPLVRAIEAAHGIKEQP